MNQIELFAGIGGFGLAGEWAGIETICQVEIDPFCQKVLQKNFPNAQRHTDIHTFDGTQYAGRVDIISGGFPCQPYSHAGKRKGDDDDRALWPEMLRVIREVGPTWVVGENVAGLISMDGGRVLAGILADLEGIGYTVETFVIPACAVGAPHRRDRLWIVAHRNGWTGRSGRKQETDKWSKYKSHYGAEVWNGTEANDRNETTLATDANLQRCEQLFATSEPGSEGFCSRSNNQKPACDSGCRHGKINGFRPKPQTQERGTNEHSHPNSGNPWQEHWLQVATRLCRVDDGFPRGLDKVKRLKALGNAIVPQVAYQIFKAIKETEQ